MTNEPIQRQSVVHKVVGKERNVVIQSNTHVTPPNVFIDHHEEDAATFDYFKSMERELPKGFRRNFVGDMDSIMTAVQLGLGRAIAPKHILKSTKGVETVKGFPEQHVPIYLNYFEQPFYTELHKAALATLSTEIAARLK